EGNQEPSVAAMARRSISAVGRVDEGGREAGAACVAEVGTESASLSVSTQIGGGVASSVAGVSASVPGSIPGIMKFYPLRVDAAPAVFLRWMLRHVCRLCYTSAIAPLRPRSRFCYTFAIAPLRCPLGYVTPLRLPRFESVSRPAQNHHDQFATR